MQREQIYTCLAMNGMRRAQHVYAPKSLVDLIEMHGGKGRIGLDETVWSFGEWEPVADGYETRVTILSLGDNAILDGSDEMPVEISGSVIPDRSGPCS